MSSDGGVTWAWQESTASFGSRGGCASVLTSGRWFILGGASRGKAFRDVYVANLPQGNPNADGGVVAGILGASAGVVVVVLILRLFVNHIRTQPWRRRTKAVHELAVAAAAEQGAHVPLNTEEEQSDGHQQGHS
jgi:hypothetical protein